MSAQPVPPVPQAIQHELDFAVPRGASSRARSRGAGEPTFDPMPGGASTRRYFRVRLGAAATPRAVAMFVPEGAKPEEVGKEPRRRALALPRSARLARRARRRRARAARRGHRRAAGCCWRTWATTRSRRSSSRIRSDARPSTSARSRTSRAPRRRSPRCPPAASSAHAPSTRSCCAGRSITSASGPSRRAASPSPPTTAPPSTPSPRRLARAHRRLAARLRAPRLPVAQPHGARRRRALLDRLPGRAARPAHLRPRSRSSTTATRPSTAPSSRPASTTTPARAASRRSERIDGRVASSIS